MNKQRMSNILSSIQMSPRDRKDFIDELSKLGQGGQGGGGEVSGEPPVRIIEVTQEEIIRGKELDIHPDEFFKNEYKIKLCLADNIKFDCIETGVHSYNKDTNSYIDIYYTVRLVNDYNYKQTISLIVRARYGQYGQSLSICKATFVNITDIVNFSLTEHVDVENLINNIEQNTNYVADYGRMLGNYYNGKFIGFGKGKIQIYDVNTETGVVSEKLSIDIETLAGLEARIAALEAAQNAE